MRPETNKHETLKTYKHPRSPTTKKQVLKIHSLTKTGQKPVFFIINIDLLLFMSGSLAAC